MTLSEAQKRAALKYGQSEKGRATYARYAQTEKGKFAGARHGQTKRRKITYKRHMQTEKGILTQARKDAKRKELGFEMINDWFPGSHGHHIDKENVLFIPSELHRSIKHSQDNLESMKLINDAAFEWFYIEEVI